MCCFWCSSIPIFISTHFWIWKKKKSQNAAGSQYPSVRFAVQQKGQRCCGCRLNVSLLPLSQHVTCSLPPLADRSRCQKCQGNNLSYFFASQTRVFSLILRKGRRTLLAAVLWFRDNLTLISHWYCLTRSSFITRKESNLSSTYFLVSSFVLMSLNENQDNFLWTENAVTAYVTFVGSKNSSALGWASAQFNPSICSAH